MEDRYLEQTDIETRARVFATAAHAAIDQRQKYTNEPYINHPAAIVEIVRSVPHTEGMIAAVWMHDVVEDTKVPAVLIANEFEQGPILRVDRPLFVDYQQRCHPFANFPLPMFRVGL